MLYRNVAQGVRCENLQRTLSGAESQYNSFLNHLEKLAQNIQIEQRRLEDLQRQAERTQDPGGFASAIRQVENKIENLKRKQGNAQNEKRKMEENIKEIENTMSSLSCNEFA